MEDDSPARIKNRRIKQDDDQSVSELTNFYSKNKFNRTSNKSLKK